MHVYCLMSDNLYPIVPCFPLLRLNKAAFEKGLKGALLELELEWWFVGAVWSVGCLQGCVPCGSVGFGKLKAQALLQYFWRA